MILNLFDSWNGKFTAPLKTHWENLGHTVRFNPQWEAMEDADINFFYPSDNVIVTASKEKKPKKGKVYVACIDIEVWANQTFAIDWDYVDGVTFIAKHIMDMVLPRIQPRISLKTALIKPGIDVEKFSLREGAVPSDHIAYVVGDRRIWDVKRFDVALMLLDDLRNTTTGYDWKLDVLGSYSGHVQYNDYCEHLLDMLNLRPHVIWHERVENVSDWLNDKNYFLLPSTKEAFSYATAEAMAKGIKPVIGNWRGATETWGPYVNRTYKEMYEKFFNGIYKPSEYRDYVVERYDQRRYFAEIDRFIELERG